MVVKHISLKSTHVIFICVFNIMFIFEACNTKKRIPKHFDEFTAIYKSYLFYDKIIEDSLFYYAFGNGENIEPVELLYIEKVKRVNPQFANSKSIINQFLYSLETYHTFCMNERQKEKLLTQNDFFTNKKFKNVYVWIENSDTIVLKGINTIDSLNFADQVTYDTLGKNINIYFNPSSCVLTCNIDRFRDIYHQRLEWLVSKKYKLGWAPFYLKPVDFGGDK